MSRQTTATTYVGIFHDVSSARQAIDAARDWGFHGIHFVSDDPAVQAELSAETRYDRYLQWRSPAVIAATFCLLGAATGLLAGAAGAWFLGSQIEAATATTLLVPVGAIFGGFVGGMLSRGYTSRAQNLYDHELGPDEILVAIEADSPARIAVAERILSNDRVAPPMPLPLIRGSHLPRIGGAPSPLVPIR